MTHIVNSGAQIVLGKPLTKTAMKNVLTNLKII